MADTLNLIPVLEKLPHRKEVESWLVAIAAGITGRHIPRKDPMLEPSIHNTESIDGRDLQKTLEIIRDIYREKGYRTPWQLENDIIQKTHPDIPARAIELADNRTAIERDRDDVTGYYHKTHEPMIVDLAMLYHEFTGKPVSAFVIDIQNLGSTTQYNSRLIAASAGREPDSYTMQEGRAITDQQIFLLSSIILEEIKKQQPAGLNAHLVEARTGGDELLIVAADMPAAVARTMIPDISDVSEEFTASMGLHNHPYGKDPDNRRADGFGAGIEAIPLKADGRHQARLDKAEDIIREHKEQLAAARHDNPAFSALKPTPHDYETLVSSSDAASEKLSAIWNRVGEMREARADTFRRISTTPSIEETAARITPHHLVTIPEMHHALEQMVAEDLHRAGIKLRHEQTRLLNAKINKFPAMDYATNTMLGHDFPDLTNAAMTTIREMNTRSRRDAPMGIFTVEFTGIGDLNREFGHVTTDEYLNHMAHSIIKPSLAEAGLESHNVYLAHMGGGRFFGVHETEKHNPDGSVTQITPLGMLNFRQSVHDRTTDMNTHGIPGRPDPIGKIENAREGPWMSGVHSVVTMGSVNDLTLRGSYVVHMMEKQAAKATADYKSSLKWDFEKNLRQKSMTLGP